MTRGEEGFTLVEVLIALALLGLLTTFAYSAVRFGAFSWTHSTGLREADAERDAVARVLRQAISRAYPGFAFADYNDRRISFDGSLECLSIVTPLPEAIEDGVMARETFFVKVDGDKKGLTMSWVLNLPPAHGGVLPAHEVLLADTVRMVQFAYFGPARPNQPSAWSETWSNMTRLPELVHIKAWRIGITEHPWLDMIVETGTTTNTDCVYAAQEPVCRRLE